MKKEAAKIVLILAVGIPLALFVWRAHVRREQSGTENLAFLHSLRGDSIRHATVSESHGTITKIVTGPAALSALVDALNSAESYEPNHPSYTHNFIATLATKNAAPREYEWHTIFPADETIYIDFPHGGNGKSKPLYAWMKSQGLL